MGKIKVTNCDDIEGLKVIEPTVFGDSRGYFMETYNYNDFKEADVYKRQTYGCSVPIYPSEYSKTPISVI